MLDGRNKSLVSDPTYAVDIRTRVVRCNKQLAESRPISRVTVDSNTSYEREVLCTEIIASKLCVSLIQNNGLLAQNPYDIIL